MTFNIEKVLENIKKEVKLPINGLLTGQAFVSFLLKYSDFNKYKKNPKNIIVNDVDIFTAITEYSKNKINEAYSTLNKKGDGFIEETLYNQYLSSYKHIYQIVESSTINKLNITKVILDKEVQYKYILESFDCNCVQVGYDLEKKELIYTKEFEEFFKTGELKVVNYHTPAISLCRAIKKAKEQGYYFNLEKESHKVGLFLNLNFYNFIGTNSLSKYEKEFKQIEDKFEISQFIFKEHLTPDSYLYASEQKFVLFRAIPKKDYSKEIAFFNRVFFMRNSYYSIEKTSDIFYGKKEKEKEKFLKIFKENKSNSRPENSYFYYLNLSTSNKETIKKYFVSKYIEEKDFSINKINEIAKICSEHVEIFDIFTKENYSYKEAIQIKDMIKKTIKKYGLISISSLVRNILNKKFNEINLIEIDKKINEYIENLSKEVFKEKYFEDFKKDGFLFKELVTGYDLALEGYNMNHCVGGYGYDIVNEYCIIVSIKHETYKHLNMTAEFTISKVDDYIENIEKKDFIFKYKNKKCKKFTIGQLMKRFNVSAKKNMFEFVNKEVQQKLYKEKIDYLKDTAESFKKEIKNEAINKVIKSYNIKGIEIEDLEETVPF